MKCLFGFLISEETGMGWKIVDEMEPSGIKLFE